MNEGGVVIFLECRRHEVRQHSDGAVILERLQQLLPAQLLPAQLLELGNFVLDSNRVDEDVMEEGVEALLLGTLEGGRMLGVKRGQRFVGKILRGQRLLIGTKGVVLGVKKFDHGLHDGGLIVFELEGADGKVLNRSGLC